VRSNVKTAIITGLAVGMILGSVRADWRFDAETGSFYDSNLSNSDRASDEKDNWAWKSNIRIGNGFQLSRDLRLNLAFDVDARVWDRFHEFNEIGPGVSAALRYRFGLGRQAPWLLVEDRLAHNFVQDSPQSGWSDRFGVRGGIGVTDRIAVEGGYTLDNFSAPGRFYDRQGNSTDVRITFDVTSSLQVAAGYAYRYGDVISYAVPPRPDILLIASQARPDDAFGTNPLYTQYHLEASTHSVSLSAAYSVTKYFSVQVAYEYATTSHDPLQYENHLVEAKVAFSY
jgi:hypothetical protein